MLYPVLTDAQGRVIDGYHRLQGDPKWKKEQLDYIKTDREFYLARLVANLQRRIVSPEEKTQLLNDFANAFEAETGQKPTPEMIAEETGMSVQWVRKYLSSEYKDKSKQRHRQKGSVIKIAICPKCHEEFELTPANYRIEKLREDEWLHGC